MRGKREYGDYQTPLQFASQVCDFLLRERKITPSVVLEPTCGVGNFLRSSLIFNASQYYGIEINPEYCEICKKEITDSRVQIINADFFDYDLEDFSKEKLLVIGNPPWVTNSTLSTLGSVNLPEKTNFKGLKGIDALTGSSNFDICESILLQLLNRFNGSDTTLAMLCKTSVARSVFKELKRQHIPFNYCQLFEIDATRIFNINASACLLIVQLATDSHSSEYCDIYSFDEPKQLKSRMGFQNGQFYNDISSDFDHFDGNCCFQWRQGVKHDCSQIMELSYKNDKLINGKNEPVQIESDLIFPLVKSSMFKKPIIKDFSKYVIVTQKKIQEDTAHIETELPKTWEYLNTNRELLDNRKSSIYHGAPAFSMFGIGDYSYAPFKVAVSGFYKEPLFSLLYSFDNKPVMTDDTTYFICFSSYDAAYTAMLFLNSDRVQAFLKRIVFLDAKRPYTKKVLERISFNKIYREIGLRELHVTEQKLGLEPYITKGMIQSFATIPEMSQQCFDFESIG